MNTKKVISHIVNWLTDYSQKSGTEGFVIGISGGIDSAVTSTLAAKTGLKLLCMELPIHQNSKQVSRAENHIQFLSKNFPNVSAVRVDLTTIFDTFSKSIPNQENDKLTQLAFANTRSRLRMLTLYHYAQLNKSLVIGTGNKIEDFGIGFFTKYGDGGVDISPIADLTKSQVYEIGRLLNVSNEIMTAPPTDGLFGDERTDEDQIGASYPELEWAMEYSENKTAPNFLSTRQKEVLAIYSRLNRINQHKWNPIPVCYIPENLK